MVQTMFVIPGLSGDLTSFPDDAKKTLARSIVAVPGSGKTAARSALFSDLKQAEKLAYSGCSACGASLPRPGSGPRLCQSCEASPCAETLLCLLHSDEWQEAAGANVCYADHILVNGKRWQVFL
jgi:hypothetical protein